MIDKNKPEAQLIKELGELRQRITELEARQTERKRAEEALRKHGDHIEELVEERTKKLRQSEIKYRNLTESLDELIYCADPETFVTTYVNSAVERIYGYTVEEWLRDPTLCESTIHPEDKERVIAFFSEAQRTLESDSIQYRIIAKDKTVRWVKDRVSWEKDQQGNAVSMNGVMYDITERKRAVEALQESEAKLRNIVEFSTNLFYSHDTNHVLQYLSPQVKDILGYEVEEALIKWTALVSDNPINDVGFQKTMSAIETGIAQGPYELELIHKSGKRVWVEVREAPVVEKGKTVAIVGSLTDITERKRGEEALRKSEAQLSNAMKMAHLGSWEYYVVSDLFTFTDSFYAIFRTTAGEVGGYTMSSADYAKRFVHPEDAPFVGKEVRKAIESDDPCYNRQLEHRMLYADGEIGYISVRFFIVKDKKGRTVRTYGVNQDITERKRAEEALRESEEKYKTLFNSAGDAIFIMNHTIFLECNIQAEKIYGCTKDQIIGHSPVEYSPEKQPDGSFSEHAAVKKIEAAFAGEPQTFEWLHTRLDGTPFCAEVNLIRVHIGEGHVLQAIVRDITERKRAEEALRQTEKELRQSQKLEAIGQLAGGVAHDFNNILMVQMGYCDLMKDRLQEEDPLAKDLVHIKVCAERAAALTRQLLAFSRKQTLEPRVLDLNAVVCGLEKILQRLIREDIDCVTVLDEDLGRVMADPSQIEQIIVNLVVNARDAMPQSGKLTIETANVELDEEYAKKHESVVPGQYVMLSITDTGCGMDDETQRRIFDPFFTTKEMGKGTGLGLAMVYGIVKQSGGNIWVYSEPGKGTTFKIYLPRTEDELIAEAECVEEEKLRGGGEYVLVVEDEPALRDLLEKILENLGYRAMVVANGGEALLAVEEKGLKPDLVITDVIMPGMSGSVLVERLHKTQPDLKVLYMSGYTDNVIVHHGVLDPGTPFLQKPFNIRDLASKIEKLLREGGAPGNGKEYPDDRR